MPSVAKHASVPSTVVAIVHDRTGNEIKVTGAGPWTLTDAQAAELKHIRVNVGGTFYPVSA